MSSCSSFPIFGNSETCCWVVVSLNDPVFLTLPYFDHLLLLGVKFSYKNRQSYFDIILIIINLHFSC